ncbi:MAG: hypothetical protein QXV88_04860 [Candidatus Bathyarchaeia archaeon]
MTSEASSISKKDIIAAREELLRIINLCKSIELKGLDPYSVDVEDLIKVIKSYFPMWRENEDLCLDAEALNHIASVVKMQSEWVKKRATKLYRDPLLIEEKIRSLPADEIAEIFLRAWRPIVELEQLTMRCFREALKYWGNLLPLSERWKKTSYIMAEPETIRREDAIKEGVLADESFMSDLERIWLELKNSFLKGGKIKYWDFINSDTFEETIRRAYLTSFLITYGYARLEINPLEDEIFILPNDKLTRPPESEVISFPIAISFEEWVKWREKQEAEREKHTMLQK